MRLFLCCIISFLLTSCALPQASQEKPTTESGVLAEGNIPQEEAASSASEISLPERLLPSGILERGDPLASLTLLIFTEYHSRYSQEFEKKHMPKLMEDFVKNGNLKIHTVIFPLKKYAGSSDAAAGLLCAGLQDQGTSMHTLLHDVKYKDSIALLKHVETLSLDQEAFASCISSEETDATLSQQKSWAESLGVSLVPTLFLNGEKFVGLPYYPDLRGRIEAAL
jgi:protein-disulfide isomerase